MQKITVLGGGSWATALVKILSNEADEIHWWVRNPETVTFIQQYQLIKHLENLGLRLVCLSAFVLYVCICLGFV